MPHDIPHALEHPPLHTARAVYQRQLSGVLAIRDLADAEAYVANTLHALGLPLDAADFDRLVLAGLAATRRIDRAVPPEQRLIPVLDEVLAPRLAAVWHGGLRPARGLPDRAGNPPAELPRAA